MYYLLQKWLNYELAKIKIVELLTLSYVIVVNLIIIIIIIITIKFKKNWRGGGELYLLNYIPQDTQRTEFCYCKMTIYIVHNIYRKMHNICRIYCKMHNMYRMIPNTL